MTRRTRTLLMLALMALVLAPGLAAARRLRCPAPFTTSCLERLYRRFDGSGPCTRDLSRYLGEGRITDCWANGAQATVTGFDGTPGTVTGIDSRGRVVLAGTSSDGQLTGAIHVTYTRKRRQWNIQRAVSGDWTVTCPNARLETFAAADIAASTGCGPLAECAIGSCPPVE